MSLDSLPTDICLAVVAGDKSSSCLLTWAYFTMKENCSTFRVSILIAAA